MIRIENLYNFKGTKFDDGRGAKGMEGTYSVNNDRLVFWTRGSDGKIYDWTINFEAWANLSGYHYGFYKVAEKFSKSSKSNDLKEAIKKNDKIIVSGHSQGCGFAVSFMWINRELFKDKEISIVLFGSPNIFTRKALKKFKAYFTNIKLIYSFKNDDDIVSNVPRWLKGFKKIKLRNNKRGFISDHLHYSDDVKYLGLSV